MFCWTFLEVENSFILAILQIFLQKCVREMHQIWSIISGSTELFNLYLYFKEFLLDQYIFSYVDWYLYISRPIYSFYIYISKNFCLIIMYFYLSKSFSNDVSLIDNTLYLSFVINNVQKNIYEIFNKLSFYSTH